ncbi:hypothetical protein HER10_EVM0006375 [Colletotrichum scovillei]|uniref:uncharacterized protein n=1 Tax=Colletotrichum scovillei TaxID=1209932 RepID=UPI0015C3671F|nr:uncharacterized protein HER10_EVM0006375 [Colletotrichum scovillei]KAF4775080.1 hypothetical protein HER10_EVM0006375 [Colletotrichum scovillei]
MVNKLPLSHGFCFLCSGLVDTQEAGRAQRSTQAWQLAAAQQQLAHLRAQVTNAAVRKRKTVQIDPNTKFANIRDIHRAQIEAGEKEVITAESSDSECPSEAGSCIVVGVVEDQ